MRPCLLDGERKLYWCPKILLLPMLVAIPEGPVEELSRMGLTSADIRFMTNTNMIKTVQYPADSRMRA